MTVRGPNQREAGRADAPPAHSLWLIPAAGRGEGAREGRYLGLGVMSAPSSVPARIPDMV